MKDRIEIINAHGRDRVDRDRIRRIVRNVLRGERQPPALVTVVFIGSRHSRRMNREFLHHDYATDVISFPLEGGVNLEAEIYVNLDRVRVQAREHGVSFANEIARLVIHGTLHLAGYDDRLKGDSRIMFERQEAYVGALSGKPRLHGMR